jgi:hypothetical protein
MTLFDVGPPPTVRRQKAVTGATRPAWSKYAPKTPARCDECVEVAFESLPGPLAAPVSQARMSRRQDGVTRLYCYPHAEIQRAEDAVKFPAKDSTTKRSATGGQRYVA